jgi:hypothetical protein
MPLPFCALAIMSNKGSIARFSGRFSLSGESVAQFRPPAYYRSPFATFALEHDPEKWAPVFRKDHA